MLTYGTELSSQISTPGNNYVTTYFDQTSNFMVSLDSTATSRTVMYRPVQVSTGTSPLNPTGTTNTTGLMMGLVATSGLSTITPAQSGRVYVTVNGVVANSTTGDGAQWQIRMGTGTDQTNQGTMNGTAYGSLESMTFLTGVLKCPFSTTALITGLTIGTAYWIDVSLAAVTGGTATMTQVAVSAFEV